MGLDFLADPPLFPAGERVLPISVHFLSLRLEECGEDDGEDDTDEPGVNGAVLLGCSCGLLDVELIDSNTRGLGRLAPVTIKLSDEPIEL